MNLGTGAKIARAALRPPTIRATATAIASVRLFHRLRIRSTSAPLGARGRRPAVDPPPDIPSGFFPGYDPYLANGWVLVRQGPKKQQYKRPELASRDRMYTYLQVANVPSADCPGTLLLLHYPNKRYLFGHIADGSQRSGIQRALNLHKVTDIFLTGPVRAQNTGGLFGMILTIADIHSSSRADMANQNKARQEKGLKLLQIDSPTALNIHGGKNLAHMLASGRAFVFRNNFPVQPNEILTDPRSEDPSGSDPDFSDPLIRVWNVPLFRSGTPGCDSENPRKRRRIEAPEAPGGATPENEQQLREGVVRAMFSSDWKLDRLNERMLSEVRLPAKIFYRDADGKIQPYEGPLPGQPGFTDRTVLTRNPWPAGEIATLPATTPAQDSLCYIVKEQPRRGKFLAQEALKLGVPKVDNKKLTAGESVTLADGTVVRPDQVMEPAPTPVGFAIIDVRDPALLDSLVNRPEWSNPEIMNGVLAFYWILSDSVKSDPRLTQLMRGFGDKVEHVVLGDNISGNELVFSSAATTLTNLNRIDPERFHLPFYSVEEPQVPSTMPENTHVARCNEKFTLAPTQGFDKSAIVPPLDPRNVPDRQLLSIPSEGAEWVLRLARQASKKVKDAEFIAMVEESEKYMPQRDAEIIPLGTGSCLPSLSRNVSATLLRIPGYGTCLLDCGENTLGQMMRMFGPEETDQILKDMRFIYLSHVHADHHLGTNTVLERLAKAQDPESPPVYIICPLRLTPALQDLSQLENLGRIRFITRKASTNPQPKTRVTWAVSDEWISQKLGVIALSAVFVDHCPDAMAVAITFPSGLKIAYSGDCRPCPQFAEIGRDAHLLIHECTFDDDRRGDAIAKRHSTFSEALSIARQMHAKRLLLTHFSQRYPKIQNPNVQESDRETESGPVTVFAFDQMRVRLGDFQYAAEYLPAIRALLNFAHEEEEVGCEGGASKCDDGNGNGNGQKGKKDKQQKQQKQKGKKQQQDQERYTPDDSRDKFLNEF
ncbi:hypothetical protein V8F06_004751 [Rhypophila decipiens]